MKFFIVRHVETTGNFENRFAGITETEYTEKGKEQFKKLIIELNKIKFDKIYSSPISRANKIASAIAESKKIKVETIPYLSEINFGIFENLTYEEITKQYPEHWEKWGNDYVNYKLPEGDSLIEFHSRIIEFVDKLKDKDGSCLIVCHGGTIQSIITHLLNLKIEDRWHFHIPLGGMVEIDYYNDYGMIKNLNSLV